MAKIDYEIDDYEADAPLPPGNYDVIVAKIDDKENSKGTGRLFAIEFEVVGGEYVRRKLFATINHTHENATAQNIGRRDFHSLCQACGMDGIDDTDQLIDRVCVVGVKVEAGLGGEPRSVIKKYLAPAKPNVVATKVPKPVKPDTPATEDGKPDQGDETPPQKKRKPLF